MAGLIYKDKFSWNYLHYFAIPKEKLPSSYSKEFGDYLMDLKHPFDPVLHKILQIKYFRDMQDVFIDEQWLLNYLNTVDESLTMTDMDNFFRGSKLLPGGNPLDPEEQYWIVEQEKVSKIAKYSHEFSFENMKDFIPAQEYLSKLWKRIKPEVVMEFREKSFKYWLKPFLEFMIQHLSNNLIILCVWNQS